MSDLSAFILAALQITLLDLALCGDNIGIIAMATKDLPHKLSKKASFIGVMGAVGLRVIFACAITLILKIQWIPIKLLGGLLLVKVTWEFLMSEQNKKEEEHNVSPTDKFWKAVAIIIIADISMSLDNVLAIAGVANGNVLLIIIGIAINIPIIFFGSQFVSKLMKNHPIVIYIGGAILAHTAFKMVLEDNLTIRYLHLPHIFNTVFPILVGAATLLYGYSVVKKTKSTKTINA